jgi:hypothetical protein
MRGIEMKKWMFLALLAAGCESEGVRAANQMADEVCACKTVECAFKAANDGKEKLAKMQQSLGSEKDGQKVIAAGKRAAECIAKLGKIE